jgi:hypothetical protein
VTRVANLQTTSPSTERTAILHSRPSPDGTSSAAMKSMVILASRPMARALTTLGYTMKCDTRRTWRTRCTVSEKALKGASVSRVATYPGADA